MSITHTILCQFKAEVKADDIKAVCKQFFALKDDCIHPTTGTGYIISLKGGKDSSIEAMQQGLTHGFIIEFASAEDRDYYVKTDPAHQAIVKSLQDIVENVIVVDFSDGMF
ncbi:stress responsive A/B barrel domain-containing protein [Trichoderma barbatum]